MDKTQSACLKKEYMKTDIKMRLDLLFLSTKGKSPKKEWKLKEQDYNMEFSNSWKDSKLELAS